jgi:hypothetical protein
MDNEILKNSFFEVVKSKQSYKNLAYLLLSFPAGLLYFILMIIGSSLGLSLVVIGIGVLILWLTFGLLLISGRGERWMARKFLQQELSEPEHGAFSFEAISKRESWKTILFLFLKFPLGIMSFSLAVSVISFILGLLTMPFFYQYEFVQVGGRSIDSLWEAIAATLFGIVLLPFGLMLLNKVAGWWRWMARKLLDAPAESKQKRLSEREALEAEIIQRLVDEGRLDGDSLVDFQEKRKNEVIGY